MRKETIKKLWIGIAILVVLSPLGLLADWLNLGPAGAWGEWGAHELQKAGSYHGNYIPAGMEKLDGLWNAVMPDYSIPGWNGPLHHAIAYIISGVVGISLIAAVTLLLGRFLSAGEAS
ncbi:fused nickel transport protein NikMN [archaeon BMS3Bbin15]|nr:fused nickel transport protein NikMN [archaeon BMS3Bbin15]